ncbi:TPA: MFS transporter [Klebsiella pneumoniae]|uniref:MFS transporter n=1 Tax=Klebsiella pneumoniae TaxID=573 RepID=UPI0015D65232|nr:MFS transporter [Klebsiella pneumoniae]HCB0512204.1 MFS transporter [Klebsiella pneumoniae]HCB1296940.1 MFS transporter [Klebsiella pneumoniae]HCI4453198.1 MFS transporter [Klebsiella pneumoniae]
MSSCIAADASLSSAKPAWRAVYALALGVFGLIVAEFLPASLLTPMASSLGVSEGMAGQAVTATALVALVTGLLIATATRNIDRRWVLMFFSILQIVSSLMVAFADSLAFLLLGRLLLGIAIGGFWAMSTATAMRLVPVAWSTWLATTVPDEAESAGGLLVASIQLAISAGAAGGGAVFDLRGASGVFTGSGLLLLSAMVIVFAAVRVKPVARADQPVTGRLSREIDN